jgi:hypothetical protein
VGDLLDAIEDLLVALLGHDALAGIALAALAGEELLEDVLEVYFGAPAKAFGKRQRNGVAIVNLGKI